MKRVKITYKELFEKLKIDNNVNEETISEIKGIKIKNDDKFVPIEAFVKKPIMNIIEIHLENGLSVKCAERHIFINEKNEEVFAKDASIIKTINGLVKVKNKKIIKKDFVYDVALPYPHLYTTTNGIIHHNTRLGDMFMQYLLDEADLQETRKKSTIRETIDDAILEVNVVLQESEGVKVAYIKNEEILSMDLFWNILQEEEHCLIFLDDLDFSLLPRTQNISTSEDNQKNKFISNLLSFTDGIFDAGNKTKFVITSNRDVSEIDTAVLRKGRTFDILNLRHLKHEEASKIWLNSGLPLEEFNEEFQEETVLQADLGSTISLKIKAKDQNKQIEPYIKEEGISVYKKIKNPKKVGL